MLSCVRQIPKDVCVIIPVYHTELRDFEFASFMQCLKILCKYDICIITYQELSIEEFFSKFDLSKNNISVEYFEKSYFTNGIDGYNKLMLNVNFYKRFHDYEYMLIYQLDAYVFRDELRYWCNFGYDYIGAPWINEESKEFWRVGNGGLSLRRISSFIRLLSWRWPVYYRHLDNFRGYLQRRHLKFNLGWHNTMNYLLEHNDAYEDVFYSRFGYATNCWITFRIPSPREALRFSFEKCPTYLFQLNNKMLPFGCHAFKRYEFESFWINYIKL